MVWSPFSRKKATPVLSPAPTPASTPIPRLDSKSTLMTSALKRHDALEWVYGADAFSRSSTLTIDSGETRKTGEEASEPYYSDEESDLDGSVEGSSGLAWFRESITSVVPLLPTKISQTQRPASKKTSSTVITEATVASPVSTPRSLHNESFQTPPTPTKKQQAKELLKPAAYALLAIACFSLAISTGLGVLGVAGTLGTLLTVSIMSGFSSGLLGVAACSALLATGVVAGVMSAKKSIKGYQTVKEARLEEKRRPSIHAMLHSLRKSHVGAYVLRKKLGVAPTPASKAAASKGRAPNTSSGRRPARG